MTKYRLLFLISLFSSYLFAFLNHLFNILPESAFYAFIFQLLFALSCPFAYMTYFIALKQALHTFHLSNRLILLKQEEDVQRQQAQKLKRNRERAKEFQAEIFGHLKILREQLKREDIPQASREMEQLSDYFEKIRMRPIASDSLLNAILQDRKELAEKNHILTNYQILLPEEIGLPHSVLSTIFFNLLDNGIESCINSGVNEPFLTLKVHYNTNFLHINMENSKNPDIIFDGKTTKPDSALHGYGLAIIEELADKYNGSCEWIDKGNTFQSLIMLHTDISYYKDRR